jgi:hypothetical protein
MIETLAGMLFLAPLGLAVYYLGRWHDIQHATVSAARYAAFAASASAGIGDSRDIELATERRFYSTAPDRYRSLGTGVSGDIAAIRPAWRTHAEGASLIDVETGLAVHVERADQPAAVERAEGVALGMIAPVAGLGAGTFDLQRSAAVRGEVVVPLRAISSAGASLMPAGVRLDERLELLVDGWGAAGVRQVVDRVGALVPSTRVAQQTALLAPLRWAITLIEPSFERFCPGRIEPDIVPADRLSGAHRPPVDLRSTPC